MKHSFIIKAMTFLALSFWHSQGISAGIFVKTPEPKKTVKILAFGASLTAGMTKDPSHYTPYADFMKRKLNEEFSDSHEFEVVTRGYPGWTTGQALEKQIYQNALAESDWDVVMILMGTNDLGHGIAPERITANLKHMFKLARNLSSKPHIVAISIPGSACTDQVYIEDRNTVNENMELYTESKSRAKFLDLYSLIPYDGDKSIWCDALHFTPLGYQKFGEYAYPVVASIIQEFH